MGESDFFVIPNEEKSFKDYLHGIQTLGNLGQTSGINALTRAIRSEWNYDGDKQRHVIMLFSDKKAKQMGQR